MVPACLREEILWSLHDDVTAGHLGFLKIYSRKRHIFLAWYVYHTVAKYVRSCGKCQRRKHPVTVPVGRLQPLDPSHRPFDVVGIDFVLLF